MLRLWLPMSHPKVCDFVVINFKTLDFASSFFLDLYFVLVNFKTLDFSTCFFLELNFVVVKF